MPDAAKHHQSWGMTEPQPTASKYEKKELSEIDRTADFPTSQTFEAPHKTSIYLQLLHSLELTFCCSDFHKQSIPLVPILCKPLTVKENSQVPLHSQAQLL